MVLIGDEAQMEACFDPFGDSANLDAGWVRGLLRMYHRLQNYFGRTRWNSQVMWVLVNFVSVRLEMVLVSVQDRCTVCAKCAIGSGIILDEMMELLGDEAMWMLVSVHLEIVLMLTQDRCTVCAGTFSANCLFRDGVSVGAR
jgi:hypothetical protein